MNNDDIKSSYEFLVNQTSNRLRSNLCNSPERSVRKSMLKDGSQRVSIQCDPKYTYTEALCPDGKFCIDGIIASAVVRNNYLYGNQGRSVRAIKGYDRIKGDRYIYLNK